jgi:hypothetical protein
MRKHCRRRDCSPFIIPILVVIIIVVVTISLCEFDEIASRNISGLQLDEASSALSTGCAFRWAQQPGFLRDNWLGAFSDLGTTLSRN